MNRKQYNPVLSSRRGLTLLELLIATLIITTVMVGAVVAFVELLNSHNKASARVEATNNARAAMDLISLELKRARNLAGASDVFTGDSTVSETEGDRFDLDQDGTPDEEDLDGDDDDSDYAVATDDRHAVIAAGGSNYAERPVFYQIADSGDAHVDVDTKSKKATLTFKTFDVPGEPIDRKVSFYVATYDGSPNTLVRKVEGTDPITALPATPIISPIAFNVVSFGALFWDYEVAKVNTAKPWLDEWDAAGRPLSTPASVMVDLAVYAGTPYTLNDLPADKKIENVRLNTVVNVESVISHPLYVASKTPITPIP